MPLNNTRLPLLLATVAGIAMIALTSWQAYSFWQSETQREGQQQTGAANAASVAEEAATPEVELASLDLFGQAGENATPQEIDTENLPETNLRLFLRGVLAADGEFPGSALIEDSESKTEAYLVGDELPGNAELRSVHANRVIIERGGMLENLYFPEADDRNGVSFAANNDNGESDEASSDDSGDSTPPASSSPATDDQRREDIRQRLEQLRERLRNNNS
ncbi:MAG: type II secretion system protein N [Pseudomonadota bacterium]